MGWGPVATASARDLAEIKAAEIRAFAVREQERGLRPSGVNGCLRALKAMLGYFAREPKALIAVYSDTYGSSSGAPRRAFLGPALAVDLAVASLQVGPGSFGPG